MVNFALEEYGDNAFVKTDMKKSFYLDSKSGFFRHLYLQITAKNGYFSNI